jgi:hypothetical protein
MLLLQPFAVYYDVENVKGPISIVINLTHSNLFRLWEIKVSLLTNLFTISYHYLKVTCISWYVKRFF